MEAFRQVLFIFNFKEMKPFLIKLIKTCLPILILSLPLDYLISMNVRKSNSCNGEYIVWNDIFQGRVASDVVIYGSSKAWVGFNPQILEDSIGCSVYNLGIDGHNFWLQYLRHKELLKFNPSPGIIILSVDMLSLEKKNDLYNLDQFLPYMLFNKDIYEYTSSYNGFSAIDYFIPLVRYAGNREALINAILYGFNMPKSDPMRIKGYRGIEVQWNLDFDNARSLMTDYEVNVDPEVKELFERFLIECRTSEIKVIIVYSPENIDNRNFFRNRSEIMDLYHIFSDKYNIPFLDYSNNPICQNKEYFYNSTHLNKKGSELFSAVLGRDVNLLLKDLQ